MAAADILPAIALCMQRAPLTLSLLVVCVTSAAKANKAAEAKTSYVTLVDSLQSWASAEGVCLPFYNTFPLVCSLSAPCPTSPSLLILSCIPCSC